MSSFTIGSGVTVTPKAREGRESMPADSVSAEFLSAAHAAVVEHATNLPVALLMLGADGQPVEFAKRLPKDDNGQSIDVNYDTCVSYIRRLRNWMPVDAFTINLPNRVDVYANENGFVTCNLVIGPKIKRHRLAK